MTSLERRSVAVLSAMYALRMAGLFLIFPVFALYAETLSGQTATLVGLALGVYGLTQSLLQIPLGIASDRFGRKPIIAAGLGVFAAGSIVAALSTSIWGVILGRALQGAGAISAPVMALLADLTREEQRTKAMAIIGVTIGASLVASLVLGPVINHAIGVPGIFWITCAGALAAIALLYGAVPNPAVASSEGEKGIAPFLRLLREPQLGRLNVGIFVIHMALTAMFLVLPHVLVDRIGLASAQHWKVYLVVMVAGMVLMVPALGFGNRGGRTRATFLAAIGLLMASLFALAQLYRSSLWLLGLLIAFFAAFNVLEAMLPSLVSRLAPPRAKGAAMGVFSTSQFFGAFVGGALGGWIYSFGGISAVFLFAGAAALLWLVLAWKAPPFRLLSSRRVQVAVEDDAHARRLARELLGVAGIVEAVVVAEEGVAYLKVDASLLDEQALQHRLSSPPA